MQRRDLHFLGCYGPSSMARKNFNFLGASIAANPNDVHFLEHTMGGASIAAKCSNFRCLELSMGGAPIAANPIYDQALGVSSPRAPPPPKWYGLKGCGVQERSGAGYDTIQYDTKLYYTILY